MPTGTSCPRVVVACGNAVWVGPAEPTPGWQRGNAGNAVGAGMPAECGAASAGSQAMAMCARARGMVGRPVGGRGWWWG